MLGDGLPGDGLVGDGLGDGVVSVVGRLTRQLDAGPPAGNDIASPSAMKRALFAYPADV